jgi:GH18 family chitinase
LTGLTSGEFNNISLSWGYAANMEAESSQEAISQDQPDANLYTKLREVRKMLAQDNAKYLSCDCHREI